MRTLRNVFLGVLVSLVTCAVAEARSDVLTVGPAGDHPGIQEALQAASDGDIVLVASDTYPGFEVDGLSVTVVAGRGETVEIDGTVSVRNLAPGQRVVLSGLTWRTYSFTSPSFDVGLELADNAGAVRVERCAIDPSQRDRVAAVTVTACDSVALAHCQLGGADSAILFEAFLPGTAALSVTDSVVSLQSCVLLGEVGGNGNIPSFGAHGLEGGPALEAVGSEVFVSGGSLTGGPGGSGASCVFGTQGSGGPGGPAVRSTSSTVTLRDVVLDPGAGGPGGTGSVSGCFDQGPSGLPGTEIEGDAVSTVAVAHRELLIDVPVEEASPFDVTVRGESGDLVAVLLNLAPAHASLPAVSGPLLVGQSGPSPVVLLGTVPADGELALALVSPELRPGVPGATVFAQGMLRGADGSLVLANQVSLVVLAAGP